MIDWEAFGLSYYEAKVFEIILHEKLELRSLAKKAGIPFGKVYSVVKSLELKGLADKTLSRPKEIFVQDPHRVLRDMLDKKAALDQQTQDAVTTIGNQLALVAGTKNKFVDIGTTLEDNARIQTRVFAEAQKEVFQILNIHHKPSSNRGAKTAWERAICDAIGRGVRFKAIYPVNSELPRILAKLPGDAFCVRRLDTDYQRLDIVDGKAVCLKLVHTDPIMFGGVLFIENKAFAANLRKVFETLWEQAV